jgi:hypothetical protein
VQARRARSRRPAVLDVDPVAVLEHVQAGPDERPVGRRGAPGLDGDRAVGGGFDGHHLDVRRAGEPALELEPARAALAVRAEELEVGVLAQLIEAVEAINSGQRAELAELAVEQLGATSPASGSPSSAPPSSQAPTTPATPPP